MTIYFIDNAAGNDGNPGTMALPWATLGKFQTTAASGDIAILKGGTGIAYANAPWTFDCDLKASGDGVVTVNPSNAGWDVFRVYGCRVRLYGITPAGANGVNQSAYRAVSAGRIEAYGCPSPIDCVRAVTTADAGASFYAENTSFGGLPWVMVGNSKAEVRNCEGINYATVGWKGCRNYGLPTAHYHSFVIGRGGDPVFMAADEFNAPGERVVFVDTVNGSDARWADGGSEQLPLKTVQAALGLPGVRTVVIENPGGPISVNAGFQLIGRTLRIVGKTVSGAEKVVFDGSETASDWVISDGAMYERPMAGNVPVMWDGAELDGVGNPRAMVAANSETECAATPGTFYCDADAGVAYVHTHGGGDPNDSVRIPKVGNVFLIVGSEVELFNIEVRGARADGVYARSGSRVYAYECSAHQNGGNGFEASTGSRVIEDKCTALSNGIPGGLGDGFGVHNQSILELTECRASFNADDGASPHAGSRLVVRGGEYTDNGDRGVVSVQGASVEIYDAEVARNGWDTLAGQNISVEGGSKAKLHRVKAYGQPAGVANVNVSGGSVAELRSVIDDSGELVAPLVNDTAAVDVGFDVRDLVRVEAQNAALL